MSESIIINILLFIFLIVIGVIILYIITLLIMIIMAELSRCCADIYEQIKKCCESCEAFLQQEDICNCERCKPPESSRISIQHTNIIINEECPICITDNNSNSISLTCNHTYHSECINPWIKQCNTQETIPMCPLCKSNII
jgi:hypothetical protein